MTYLVYINPRAGSMVRSYKSSPSASQGPCVVLKKGLFAVVPGLCILDNTDLDCVYVCVYICVYMYLGMYINIYVYLYIYICTHLYAKLGMSPFIVRKDITLDQIDPYLIEYAITAITRCLPEFIHGMENLLLFLVAEEASHEGTRGGLLWKTGVSLVLGVKDLW